MLLQLQDMPHGMLPAILALFLVECMLVGSSRLLARQYAFCLK